MDIDQYIEYAQYILEKYVLLTDFMMQDLKSLNLGDMLVVKRLWRR